ncbi:MAG TPA: hypothetical protein DIW41_05460, partial [Lachnospiraceae bacterium]|jgi:hypothetical protein|nr:hypothetical protein [Lachnospiraceae bacterium]
MNIYKVLFLSNNPSKIYSIYFIYHISLQVTKFDKTNIIVLEGDQKKVLNDLPPEYKKKEVYEWAGN